MEKYAAEIADYWYIPEEARWDVLKAYYNGIFNGDEMGNFNPGSALTRAEMSKVVAVISDPSMRKRNEYRTLADGFVFDEESFETYVKVASLGETSLTEFAKGQGDTHYLWLRSDEKSQAAPRGTFKGETVTGGDPIVNQLLAVRPVVKIDLSEI